MTVTNFTERLLTLRTRFPFSVHSWFRTPSHNERVGGAPNSFHIMGLAVDVLFDEVPDGDDLRKTAMRLGLQAIDEGDHWHIEANI